MKPRDNLQCFTHAHLIPHIHHIEYSLPAALPRPRKTAIKNQLVEPVLTGCGLLLNDEAADVAGKPAETSRLAHVRPRVRVADAPDRQPRVVAPQLVLVEPASAPAVGPHAVLELLLLAQRLVVLEPLDPGQRLADHVTPHAGLLARSLRLESGGHAHLRDRWGCLQREN